MSYFVQIENPVEIRRTVLLSTKDVLSALTGCNQVLVVREEKREAMKELADTMNELQQLVTHLDKLLPERSLKEVEQFLPKDALKPKRAARQEPLPSMPARTLPRSSGDELHDALAAIEERLSKL